MKKLYVGNLPYSFNDQKLAELFAEFGNVQSATIIMDRMSGRSKGFGFVEIDDEGATAAMDAFATREVEGRVLKVNEARPMTEKRDNFRGGNGDRRNRY